MASCRWSIRTTTASSLCTRIARTVPPAMSEQRGDAFRQPLGDHDRRQMRESGRHVGHDRRVDHAQPLYAVRLAPLIDDGTVFGPWTHRARSDDVGEGVAVATD